MGAHGKTGVNQDASAAQSRLQEIDEPPRVHRALLHPSHHGVHVLGRFDRGHRNQHITGLVGSPLRNFANQLEINPQNLRAYAEKFATAHKVDLPFVLDPGGKLAALVNADRDLGKAIKLDHTPTVYIVSNRNPSKPYVEVKDNSQLYLTIDSMMKE